MDEKGLHTRINANNAKELGRLGGIKSGESKRRKKSMRESLELLLSMPIDEGKLKTLESFKNFHKITKESNVSVQDRILVNLVKLAMSGDIDAIKIIREQIGEKPKDEVEVTTIEVPRFEGEDELKD